MSSKLEEIKLDIEELNGFLQQATRQKNKDLLSLEIRKLQTIASQLMEESQSVPVKGVPNTSRNTQKCYEVKINNYGWDQTNTTVKLYVTLPLVHQLPKENVTCDYTKNSVTLRVTGLENRNYNLHINNLCEEINAEKCSVRVKTDMVVVSMSKQVPRDWSHITDVEKRIKESKSANLMGPSDDASTGASLMNLMKKMYVDGDDDMKRTIAKTWTDVQEKKMPGISDFS